MHCDEREKQEAELKEKTLEVERLRSERDAPTAEVSPQQLVPEAKLSGKRMKGVYRDTVDLVGVDFSGAEILDCAFPRSTLTRADFSNAGLRDVQLEDAKLNGASFRNSVIEDVDFTRADLREADFSGATFARKKGARPMTLSRADIRGAKGLTCKRLVQIVGWETAHRDKRLACGEPIPEAQRPGS